MSEYIIEDIHYSQEEINELIEPKSTGYATLAGVCSTVLFIGACNTTNASVVKIIPELDTKPNIEYIVTGQSDFCLEDYQNVFLDYNSRYFLDNEKSDKEKRETIEAILSFKSLHQSWDGYGALPLEVKSARNAIEFLETLDLNSKFFAPTDIFPNPTGTVSLIWENNESERVSLEIGNDAFSYYTKFNNIDPEFFNDVEINNVSIGDITGKIKAIY